MVPALVKLEARSVFCVLSSLADDLYQPTLNHHQDHNDVEMIIASSAAEPQRRNNEIQSFPLDKAMMMMKVITVRPRKMLCWFLSPCYHGYPLTRSHNPPPHSEEIWRFRRFDLDLRLFSVFLSL